MQLITKRSRLAALPLTAALAAVMLAAMFLLIGPRVARAAGVVNPCNQANLAAALAGGGHVTFNCGGPTTITLTSQINITQDTTIDGGALGLVTLSSDLNHRIFSTTAGTHLWLFNLILTNGGSGSNGGALYVLGPTVISNSAVYNSESEQGGAVYAGALAPLSVVNSLFQDNFAKGAGGAISALADVSIAASQFISNVSNSGGGVYVEGGDLAVADSLFAHNDGGDEGGGLTAYYGNTTIAGSEFYSNSADYGGALASYSVLTLTNSSQHHNVTLYSGGAMYLGDLSTAQGVRAEDDLDPQGDIIPGQVFLSGVDIYNNEVTNAGGYGGAIDLEVHGLAEFDHVRIYNNRVVSGTALYGGGGLAAFYGTVVLANSAIFGNHTYLGPGGGIHASYGATVTLQNTSVYSNVVEAGSGGGIDISNNKGQTRLRIYNSTISGNAAEMGGGINMNAANTYAVISFTTLYGNLAAAGNNFTGTTELFSSIVAGSGGLNCGGAVKSFGHNIEDGDTCTLGATGDITGTNPLLGPLGPNGGPTWTHPLLAGSPAIDTADPVNCPPTDQRGGARPVDGDNAGGARCDMGAVEFAAIVGKIFLPLVIR